MPLSVSWKVGGSNLSRRVAAEGAEVSAANLDSASFDGAATIRAASWTKKRQRSM
jgi:hypothetical protein